MSSFPQDPTALRLEGRDALPLLHRISTQALLDLKPGESRATLFCDFRGRLLHRTVVTIASNGAIWLLRPDAPGFELAAFLDRHVFRDDVRIVDRSGSFQILSLGKHSHAYEEREGEPEWVTDGPFVLRLLEAAASIFRGPVAEERSRIRAGRARHGHEITEDFNPYEVGLAGDVHLDKGCYTGQEALQRLITYGAVRRELARVSGSGPVPAVPAEVTRAGELAGVITSAVADEQPGRWIGLAVLKKEVLGDPAALEVGGGALAIERLPATSPAGLPQPQPKS